MLQKVSYQLGFKLTAFQKIASFYLCKNIFSGHDVLIEAVCGSGKTEITMALIAMFLTNKKKVAFACPRRTVVEQVYQYFQKSYVGNAVGCCHGIFKKNLCSSLMVITCHQLSNYKNYFDLLIIDEADAFPLFNNFELVKQVLESKKSNGRLVLLSATLKINYFQIANLKKIKLYKRHHQFPIPLPIWRRATKKNLVAIAQKWIGTQKPFLIFCPTIIQTQKVASILDAKPECIVHSKIHNYQTRVSNFRKNSIPFLVTTTILERGLTFKNVQVLVWNADHEIFLTKTLLQISGRVGRSVLYPKGEVYFLAKQKTRSIKASFEKIKEWNLVK